MFVRSSGPAGLQLCPVLLGCFDLLGNHCFLLWLIKAGVHYVPAMPCHLLAVSCCSCFPYLDYPLCAISCVDYCHIRHASSPPKAYQRHKGDSSIPTTVLIPKGERDICVYSRYLLCLGPGH